MRTKLSLLLFLFLLPSVTASQVVDAADWQLIGIPSGEFAALVPPGLLVHNENYRVRIFAQAEKATISITANREGDPKDHLRKTRSGERPASSKYASFKLGEFSVDTETNTEANYSMMLFIASKKNFYTISVSSTTADNAAVSRFLSSVRLSGLPLFKQQKPDQHTGVPIPIYEMETSQIARDALKRPNSRKREITLEKNKNITAPQALTDPVLYSRKAIILEKRHAQFPEYARETGARVTLRVTLLANGDIGDIVVLNRMRDAFAEEAIKAAETIKFLPAEVDGKPVDKSVTIVYSFGSY